MKTTLVTLKTDLKIHAIEAGDPQNPSMVLLHGYPASAEVWHDCIPRLSARYHLLAPDLPGHGQSDKPLKVVYDQAFLQHFLEDYLQAAGLEKVHLVCHDLGALAGLGFASQYPERVESLVVMDTGPYPDWPPMAKVLIALMKSRWLTPLLLNQQVFRLLFRHAVFTNPSRATAERIARFRTPWVQDAQSRKAFRRTISASPQALALTPAQLGQIQVPTLILWAEDDRFFPPAMARRLQKDINDAMLRIIPNSGHFLQAEQPEAVVQAIEDFLADIP